MSSQFELKIVPCIDSLLYAPVYLAILMMGKAEGAKWNRRESILDVTVGENDHELRRGLFARGPSDAVDTLRIRIAEAANGDTETLEQVEYESDRSLTVGICDPKTVIDHNRALYKKPHAGGEWSPSHHIVSVLIDRIALGILIREPPSNFRTANHDQELRKRNKALFEITEQLLRDPGPTLAVLKKNAALLKVRYWARGNTTKFLARRYLQLEEPEGEGVASNWEPEDDVAALEEGHLDVVVTHAPWAVDLRSYKNIKVLGRQSFPSIQFPFSCLVTPASPATQGKPGPAAWALKEFLRAVRRAIVFLSRDPDRAVRSLSKSRDQFRSFGIRDDKLVESEVQRAINYFRLFGGYSDNMWPEWPAWQYALSLDEAWRPQGAGADERGAAKDWWEEALKVTLRTLDAKYCPWRGAHADTNSYWESETRLAELVYNDMLNDH